MRTKLSPVTYVRLEMLAHSLIDSSIPPLVCRASGCVCCSKGDWTTARSLTQYQFNRNNKLHLSLLCACEHTCLLCVMMRACLLCQGRRHCSYQRLRLFEGSCYLIFVNNSLNEWSYYYLSKIIIILIIIMILIIHYEDIWSLTRRQYYT